MGALAESDGYGMAAFTCGVDGSALEPVAETAGVLRCPRCAHRTDQPGDGVLGDGFDVRHRQWGLRGDVHAWRAMGDLVATTPTSTDRDAVRAAYVDALRRVADVELDDTEAQVVHRAHLDHGGMSGGSVDLVWWRTKGIPLLVERAVDRRPATPRVADASPSSAAGATATPRRTARKVLGDIAVWGIVLAIPAALLGGGGFLLYERAFGTRVEATVLECDTSGSIVRGASTYRTDCIAEWEIDDRTVIGPFTGGNGESDVGKTVDATVRGDTAYGRSLAVPILLLALGLPFLAIPSLAIRAKWRARVS